ncbi:fibrinogen-like protein A [Anopheles aquasalis]|uniref:fibrinogen-like protein A n=1 Tax=Anopheles aquasalis TaxID=42839 RepID=UPI00215B4649|nr:fibrinogen-like protein A [Anopheles aquasalis]
MKLTICFLLYCVLYAGATTKSCGTVDAALDTPSSERILAQGLEMVLAKLAQMDRKLVQLHFDTTTTTPKPQVPSYSSCRNVPSNVSGVYLINPNKDSASFNVYCEQEKFEGGWIVMQHRFDGSVDFYRNWTQYREGFGELDSEFWLGLERIHQLTTARTHELIVEVRDFRDNYGYARYSSFHVDSESENYKLKVLGSYSGTAGNSMNYLVGRMFSTLDRDNDGNSDINHAVTNHGAWWYPHGNWSNLNGPYKNTTDCKGNWWHSLKNDCRGLRFARMMIRELKR